MVLSSSGAATADFLHVDNIINREEEENKSEYDAADSFSFSSVSDAVVMCTTESETLDDDDDDDVDDDDGGEGDDDEREHE